MELVFAGTPAFAVPSLHAVVHAGHRVLAVYTQPDRPAGRGRKLMPTAVKAAALEQGLPIRQPAKLREETAFLRDLRPDALVVVAYGQLLTPETLDIPRYGCINVHASLLPRWRGAAPVARAIEAGDTETGVTIMQMAAGLDTGDILLQAKTPIAPDDTTQTLHDRLALLGAEALVQALAKLVQGELLPQPQDEMRATYARKLVKEEALLDWSRPASALALQVRAFNPWPVAHARLNDELLRIWDATAERGTNRATRGEVIAAAATGIVVQTGDGVLRLLRLQAEGGRALSAREFLNGHPLNIGARLGR